MSAHVASQHLANPRQPRAAARSRLLGAAAAGYSLAWLAGLAMPVTALDLDATGEAVVAAVSRDQAAMLVRSVLVHGVAAAALAIVAIAVGRSASACGGTHIGHAIRITGLMAAGFSLGQFVMEFALAGSISSRGDAVAAGMVTDAINRLDGVKMLALAAFVLAGTATLRYRLLPRWLGALAAVLVPALIVSAVAYGLLIPSLAVAAYVSLPLLLVWVTGAGVLLARNTGH